MSLYKRLIEKLSFGYLSNKSTVKNASWIISDKVYIMIFGVIVTAVVARYFGPEKFGLFNYSMSIVIIFSAISTLGLPVLTVKSLVDYKFNQGIVITTSLLLRLFGSIVLMGLALLTVIILEPNNNQALLLVLIISSTMIFKSFEVIDYWLQTYHLAKVSSIIKIATYTITASTKLLIVFFKLGIFSYALTYLLDSMIVGFALFIAFKVIKPKDLTWKFSLKYAKYILSNSWYLVISGLMVSIYMQIDKIMLGSMLPLKDEVGIYSAATQISQMWFFVPMALITSMQPVILRAKNHDYEKYQSSIKLLYRFIAWLGFSFAIFVLIFSPFIVKVLYGEEFIRASSILTISVWAGTFAILGSARAVWLVAENLQKYSVLFMGFGSIINVLLNFLLIPNFQSYGAAIATLVSQIVVVILSPLLWKKTRKSTFIMLKSIFTLK